MRKEKLSFLIFGDIFGSLGRKIAREQVSSLKLKYHPDLTLANVENLTHGAGFSTKTITELMDAGIEFFTGGNHSLENRPGVEALSIENIPIIRPANLGKNLPGLGYQMLEIKGHKILIMNLLGTLFMKGDYENPFPLAEKILGEFKREKLSAVLLDMHAETTSEKAAIANFLDGKVSVVYGTHTHIPTADERILNKGTGFITDVGFTGPLDSVIGVNTDSVVANFSKPLIKTKTSIVETGRGFMNCIYVEVDTKTGNCTHIERILKYLD